MLTQLLKELQSAWRARKIGVDVWYHEDFRIPLESPGIETKRSDYVAWALLDLGIVPRSAIVRPEPIRYRELCAVHTDRVLQALSDPRLLAPVFGVTPEELPTTSLSRTLRLACGATLGAARRALAMNRPQLNLLGGFHHASPDRASGFSAVNDVAVAIRSLLKQSFEGRIAVLDLDAHPPDGTANCVLAMDKGPSHVWIGSISGSDWGTIDGVDETVITGADDSLYLRTLESLLERMPDAELAFVVAGGDVLAQDRLGALNLTLEGARRRDRAVLRRLENVPVVWLPAGGYSDDAWRLLFGSAACLAGRSRFRIPGGYNPLRTRFSNIARELDAPEATEALLTEDDIAEALGYRPQAGSRLLNVYTVEWLEYALERYGFFEHIERLGYSDLRLVVDRFEDGDRLRAFGSVAGAEHMLVECQLDRVEDSGESWLFVNWMTLRHPISTFTAARPRLPNQEVPGLGLAREAGEILGIVARRLHLAGVAIRPAAYHVAWTAQHDFHFADPEREGRFRKLAADLGHVPLAELTRAIDAGRVQLDGEPYIWEASLMIYRLSPTEFASAPCTGTFTLAAEDTLPSDSE